KIEGINETFQKTAIKGRSFENELLSYLEEVAKPLNDIVEFTGDFAEDGTLSKKGDFIYTLNSGQSILIEAKDRELGVKPSIDYLKEGMERRGKKFSILTFKYENQLPKSVDLMGFYESNKILTSKEYLKFAIQWARIFLNKNEDKLAEGINENLLCI
uniref:hypothetical protein n=1 Tax=Flavobacterium sp. TaxID=239 RepID=UPI0035B1972C